jgi:hypothetical protein
VHIPCAFHFFLRDPEPDYALKHSSRPKTTNSHKEITMSFFSWLAAAIGNRQSATSSGLRRPKAGSRKPLRFRPQLEALEDRWLPSTLTVLNTNDSGPGSLRAEIAAAQSGDTIQFAPSLSGQTIMLLHSELVINKNLTIQGPSAPNAPVTVSGQRLTRIFEVDGAQTNVALSNLDLIDGTGLAGNAASAGAVDGQGGAIWNGGMLTITGCNLNQNADSAASVDGTDYGGAVYNAGTLSVQNCILDNNSAGNTSWFAPANGQGGAIYNAGKLTVSNSTLDNDNLLTVPSRGGAIANGYKASATITNSTLSGNGGGFEGGAIYNQGTMTLSGCTVSRNFAVDGVFLSEGGGIYNGPAGSLTILNSVVTGNSPNDVYNVGIWLSFGSITYNSKKRLYSETVTLTNNTSGPLTGPLSLELTNLPSGVVLTDATATTNGNPYVRLISSGKTLNGGGSVSITLTFTAASSSDITFGTQLVAL